MAHDRERRIEQICDAALAIEAAGRDACVADAWAAEPRHVSRMSARMMRRILIDSARARGNDKRGDGLLKVSLDGHLLVSPQADPNLVALDVTPDTVKCDRRFARLWLLRELSGERPDGA